MSYHRLQTDDDEKTNVLMVERKRKVKLKVMIIKEKIKKNKNNMKKMKKITRGRRDLEGCR